MMDENMTFDGEPFAVLGIDPSSTSEQVRSRYLELVRQCPPEREPERFERIRQAYELASDPIRRWETRLFGGQEDSIEPLLASFRQVPRRLLTNALLRVGKTCVLPNSSARAE